MKYDVGPCSCGHTMTVEAANEEEALQKALDGSAAHVEEFHKDDPDKDKLLAMSRDEMAGMMRPLVHAAQPA
ncbi:MAG TPA: hypothetical protein VLF21_01545 [Candidatus Saccharimonadales bacterium]|nr:hypothetical protein [Candidatus Saccharimonadales bacterium]